MWKKNSKVFTISKNFLQVDDRKMKLFLFSKIINNIKMFFTITFFILVMHIHSQHLYF